MRSQTTEQGHVTGQHDPPNDEQLGHVSGDVPLHTTGHEQHRQRFDDERPAFVQQ